MRQFLSLALLGSLVLVSGVSSQTYEIVDTISPQTLTNKTIAAPCTIDPTCTIGSGGAPANATYLTGSANGTLTNAIVVTPTDDTTIVGNGTTWQVKALTDCQGAGKAVTYTVSTNTWGCNTISGGAPGGSNTQVQFNDSSAFGGAAGLTYNKTTQQTTLDNGANSNSILVVKDNGTTVMDVADATTANGDFVRLRGGDAVVDGPTVEFTGGSTNVVGVVKSKGASGSLELQPGSATSSAVLINNSAGGTARLDMPQLGVANSISIQETAGQITFEGATNDTFETRLDATDPTVADTLLHLPNLGATDTLCAIAATQTLTNKSISASQINAGTLAVAQGGTNLAAAADDNVMIGDGTTWQTKAVPNCIDTGGNHLNYTAATNAISCGTSGSGGISGLTSPKIPKATSATSIGDSSVSDDGTNVVTAEPLIEAGNSGITAPLASYQFEVANDTSAARIGISQAAAGVGTSPSLGFIRYRGTHASPTAVQSGDTLATIQAYGGTSTTLGSAQLSAHIIAKATENYTSTTTGSKWDFSVTPNGSFTPGIALTIDQDKSITFAASAGAANAIAIQETAGQITFEGATADTFETRIDATDPTGADTLLHLPNLGATDTFCAIAAIQTLTNKTYDTAGTGNVFKINGTGITAISGNTGTVATTSGALTNGDSVKVDASGNLVDTGAAVVTPSSITTFTNKTLDVEATGNVLTTVSKVWLGAAGCNNATASTFYDLPTANAATPACVTGTNIQKGVLQYADSANQFGQYTMFLPADWTGAVDARVIFTSADITNAHTEKWTVATACRTPTGGSGSTDDPTFNTANTLTYTNGASEVASALRTVNSTGITTTGCVAGDILHLKFGRDTTDTDTGTMSLVGWHMTLRRAQ